MGIGDFFGLDVGMNFSVTSEVGGPWVAEDVFLLIAVVAIVHTEKYPSYVTRRSCRCQGYQSFLETQTAGPLCSRSFTLYDCPQSTIRL